MKKYIYTGVTTTTIEVNGKDVQLYNGAEVELPDDRAGRLKAKGVLIDAPASEKKPVKA